MDKITVSKALSRGHRMVTFPTIIIIILGILACIFVGTAWKWDALKTIGASLMVLLITFLVWRRLITRWRLWAFEQVNQPNRLMIQAIQENLIYPEGHWVTRLEARTEDQKQQWEMILLRMEQPDKFEDDFSISQETIIKYSGWKNWFQFTIYVAMGAGGIYLMMKTDSGIMGLIFFIIGVVLSIIEFRQATNKKPQIILSNKGIETADTPFYSWDQVTNELATQEGSGKHIRYYLEYDHPAGSEKFSIDDMATDIRSLNELLVLYRGRFEQGKKHGHH